MPHKRTLATASEPYLGHQKHYQNYLICPGLMHYCPTLLATPRLMLEQADGCCSGLHQSSACASLPKRSAAQSSKSTTLVIHEIYVPEAIQLSKCKRIMNDDVHIRGGLFVAP